MTRSGAYPLAIRGDRLLLRDFGMGDLDATLAIVGDPQVTACLSFDAKTRAEQQTLLTAQVARAQDVPRTEYYLAVVREETGDLVGFVRLGLGVHLGAKLGYAIRRADWGSGFATEAASLMLEFGFEALGLHRITAACGPDNFGSIRVLEKLNFTFEGRLRDHVFTNGKWRDSLLYSRLSTDLATTGSQAAP